MFTFGMWSQGSTLLASLGFLKFKYRKITEYFQLFLAVWTASRVSLSVCLFFGFLWQRAANVKDTFLLTQVLPHCQRALTYTHNKAQPLSALQLPWERLQMGPSASRDTQHHVPCMSNRSWPLAASHISAAFCSSCSLWSRRSSCGDPRCHRWTRPTGGTRHKHAN